MPKPRKLNFSLPKLVNAESIDLNIELAQINQMVNAGILPSEERIAEYLAACCQRQEFASHRKGLINCLINICRLQEEQAIETNPRLKEILVMAESLG